MKFIVLANNQDVTQHRSQSRMLSTLKTTFQKYKRLARRLLPILILISYSLLGGVMFWLTETSVGPVHTFGREPTSCLSQYDFWGSLYFTGCLFTSIGYGTVYPCSRIGRFLTMVYTAGGLPLFVYALDVIGMILLDVLVIAWNKVKHLIGRLKEKKLEKFDKVEKKTVEEDDDDLPIYSGFILTFLWLCICSSYFCFLEKWPYLESFYFTFISVTSIGLGDFAATSVYNFSPAHFTLITIAMAMVSLTIKIFQKQLDRFIYLTKKRIFDNFKKRMGDAQDGVVLQGDPKDLWNEAKAEAGLMRFFITDKVRLEIQEEINERSRQVNVHTATQAPSVHAEIQAVPECLESFSHMNVETVANQSEAQLSSAIHMVETQTEIEEEDNNPGGEWIIASDESDLDEPKPKPKLNSYQKLEKMMRLQLKKATKFRAKSAVPAATDLLDSRLEAILVLTDDPILDELKPGDTKDA